MRIFGNWVFGPVTSLLLNFINPQSRVIAFSMASGDRGRVAPQQRGLYGCRKGLAALEFALLATPLMLLVFGSVATCLAIYTMSAMQNAAQYSALRIATGQSKSFVSGVISATNTTSTTNCTSSLTSSSAEYYACQGLPPWATFKVTATENCTTPSVTVSLSVDASQAAVADVFSLFSGKNLTSTAVVMKEGTCP